MDGEVHKLEQLVMKPSDEDIDKLAGAFFASTGHGKLMKWEDFKKNFALQHTFFKVGVLNVLKEICNMSDCEFDISRIRKDLVSKMLNGDDKKENDSVLNDKTT